MIGLGCDHGGLELKKTVMEYLDSKGIEYKDFGTYTSDSCDYPVYGKAVAHAVADGQCDKGIIICGTGIGISITANKVKGIRAALCHDVFSEKATMKQRVTYLKQAVMEFPGFKSEIAGILQQFR